MRGGGGSCCAVSGVWSWGSAATALLALGRVLLSYSSVSFLDVGDYGYRDVV